MCVAVYVAQSILYNLFFHPLRSYPGPVLAKISIIWSRQANFYGLKYMRIHEAHRKYGPVVRIAPNELSFADPAAVRDIYTNSGFQKEENFYFAKRGYEEEHLFSFRPALVCSYLQEVTNETLCMYPTIVAILPRVAKKDTTVAGLHIPKGTVVGTQNYTIHCWERAFPDPDNFLPERWLDGKNVDARKEAFVSFSVGPRRCIGMKLYAHCFVAWVVHTFVMYAIMREFFSYINLRQAFLLTPQYAKRISSRIVLFTSVPKECLDEDHIRSLFNSVKNVWIAGDTKRLDKIIQERDNVAMKLEKAEIDWIRLCNKERIKYEMKTGNEAKRATTSTSDPEPGNLVTGCSPEDKRPTHRTGPLGLIGERVDIIQWGRKKLKDLIPEAQSAQNNWLTSEHEKHTAFFVEFSTQHDAQVAFQTATHHRPLQMSPRFISIKPNEVIWKSLNYSWWQVAIRRYVIYAIITGLVVFWALPVTIVGIIAQVNTIKSLPGLAWIQNIPQVILGAVSGLLPSIALSILMSSVPVFIRTCARWSGCVSTLQAELFTQKAYFIFQVLQVFLVQTLSNSFISSLVTILRNPNNVFGMLSSSIPTASNFYISFSIVQGLTIATSVLTQVFEFDMFTLSSRFTNRAPRIMYDKWTTLSTISLGSLMPIYTNMAVISEELSIIYSVIAPFLLFWSTISMGLFYLAYRYNILL
ncbi:hypothetical protein FOBRF1_013127 [Fusarium oxysporum]